MTEPCELPIIETRGAARAGTAALTIPAIGNATQRWPFLPQHHLRKERP
jgi:hypothetical protein